MIKATLAAFVSLTSLLVWRALMRARAFAKADAAASGRLQNPRHPPFPGDPASTPETAAQPPHRSPTTCVVGLRGIPDVPGGIETHCEQLYPRLAALRPNESFIIVGRRPTIGQGERICGENLRVKPIAAARNRYFETVSNTFLGVLAARLRFGAQSVHLHGIGPGLFAPMARLLGLRVVLTHHGDDFLRAKWNRLARFVLKTGERLGVSTAHEVIAVSASLAARLRADYPSRAARIHYIPNGADHILAAARSATRPPEAWRAKFGLAGEDYILSVGRLVPEKGFADLIAAYARARPAAKLVIVGGKSASDHDEELFAQIAALGLQGRVVMTGAVPHEGVAALMAGARLFVLASHHEGLPIVALEASAMGAPMLLSDIVPNRDLGLSAEHYFPMGDVTALARALALRWNRVPHQDLMAQFNWRAIAAKTHAVYTDLARA